MTKDAFIPNPWNRSPEDYARASNRVVHSSPRCDTHSYIEQGKRFQRRAEADKAWRDWILGGLESD